MGNVDVDTLDLDGDSFTIVLSAKE